MAMTIAAGAAGVPHALNALPTAGGYTRGRHDSLLVLGVLLALYDGAEVVLKPVFGALSDRVGPGRCCSAGSPPSRCSPPHSWLPAIRR
jgi:hypothetical protein